MWDLNLQVRAQDISLVGAPRVPAKITIARTNIPRFSLRSRSMTSNCWQRPSIFCWGSIGSKTCRTSSPVMALSSDLCWDAVYSLEQYRSPLSVRWLGRRPSAPSRGRAY